MTVGNPTRALSGRDVRRDLDPGRRRRQGRAMRVFETIPPSVFLLTVVAAAAAAALGALGALAVLLTWMCCELGARVDSYGVHRDKENR